MWRGFKIPIWLKDFFSVMSRHTIPDQAASFGVWICTFYFNASNYRLVNKIVLQCCEASIERVKKGFSSSSKPVGVTVSSLFQLVMGILQVGFVVMYLSDTLVSGFTTAAAIHILVSQLKFVLGLQVPGISGPLSLIYVNTDLYLLPLILSDINQKIKGYWTFFYQTLESIFTQITSSNVCDVVIALVIMLVVLVVKELNDRFKSKLPVPIPIEVIMVSIV